MVAHPSPVFEGSEKRLEIDFWGHPDVEDRGLRALSREQLDFMLEKVRYSWVGGGVLKFWWFLLVIRPPG
jgi:Adenosylmethionine decarboxylase